TCYKIVRRSLLNEMQLRSNGFELCAEITGKLCRMKAPILERPISYRPRGYEEGKKIGVGAFVKCVKELLRSRFATEGQPGPEGGSMGASLWFRRGIVVAILTVVCAGGYWIGSAPRRNAARHAALTVPDTSLDFGEVWEDPAFVWKLPIENNTDEPIA